MDSTVIVAVLLPLIIAGMVFVIMWGMSAAGLRHEHE
jgi:hypothetical protein